MARKMTIVVSTKISPEQYTSIGFRLESLHKSGLIRNPTLSSYLKRLIERDLYMPKTQYEKLLWLIDNPSSCLPPVESDNSPVTTYGVDF